MLVVDDARWQRLNLAKILKAAGHEVIEAADGAEALTRLATDRPEAVVCDLQMPNLDGFGFLAEAQTRDVHVPIVVASADIQESSRLRCKQLGAVAFVAKPFQAADILEALAEAIHVRRAV